MQNIKNAEEFTCSVLFTVVKQTISHLLLNLTLRVSVAVCMCEKTEKTMKTCIF